MPNILGNCSFPVHTYRWVDIAASDNIELLKQYQALCEIDGSNYRIVDTEEGLKDGSTTD